MIIITVISEHSHLLFLHASPSQRLLPQCSSCLMCLTNSFSSFKALVISFMKLSLILHAPIHSPKSTWHSLPICNHSSLCTCLSPHLVMSYKQAVPPPSYYLCFCNSWHIVDEPYFLNEPPSPILDSRVPQIGPHLNHLRFLFLPSTLNFIYHPLLALFSQPWESPRSPASL